MLLGSQASNLPRVRAGLGELVHGTLWAQAPKHVPLSVGASERGARLHQCIRAGRGGCTDKQRLRRGANPGSVFEMCP